jgi:hypothetical protein
MRWPKLRVVRAARLLTVPWAHRYKEYTIIGVDRVSTIDAGQ